MGKKTKAPAAPQAPADLSDAAREKWQVAHDELAKSRPITPGVLHLLELYARNWQGYIECSQRVKDFGAAIATPQHRNIRNEKGEVVTVKSTVLKANPFKREADKHQDQIAKLSRQLGLTGDSPQDVPTIGETARTHDDIARHFNFDRSTVREWVRKEGWPAKVNGLWRIADIDAWLKARRIGPYYNKGQSPRDVDPDAPTLLSVQIQKTIQSGERDRIAKELGEIELAKQRGLILISDEVFERDEKIAGAVITILQQIPAQVGKRLPKKIKREERESIVSDVSRMVRDALSLVENVVEAE